MKTNRFYQEGRKAGMAMLLLAAVWLVGCASTGTQRDIKVSFPPVEYVK